MPFTYIKPRYIPVTKCGYDELLNEWVFELCDKLLVSVHGLVFLLKGATCPEYNGVPVGVFSSDKFFILNYEICQEIVGVYDVDEFRREVFGMSALDLLPIFVRGVPSFVYSSFDPLLETSRFLAISVLSLMLYFSLNYRVNPNEIIMNKCTKVPIPSIRTSVGSLMSIELCEDYAKFVVWKESKFKEAYVRLNPVGFVSAWNVLVDGLRVDYFDNGKKFNIEFSVNVRDKRLRLLNVYSDRETLKCRWRCIEAPVLAALTEKVFNTEPDEYLSSDEQ